MEILFTHWKIESCWLDDNVSLHPSWNPHLQSQNYSTVLCDGRKLLIFTWQLWHRIPIVIGKLMITVKYFERYLS